MAVSKTYQAYVNAKEVPEEKSLAKYRAIYVDIKDFINDTYTKSEQHTWSTKKIYSMIPKTLSALINDTGFITDEDAEEIATEYFRLHALSYYLKEEVYNKDEIDDIIDNFSNMRIIKVDELPEVGDPEAIYLVPKTTKVVNENDGYDEYIYIDGSWEFIGGVGELDLSNYYTKKETESLVDTIIDDESLSPDTAWSSEKIISYIQEYMATLDGNKIKY